MERLEQLYEELANMIPEELVEDFIGAGCAVGPHYADGEKRLLIVEKIPKIETKEECGCHDHRGHNVLDGIENDDTDFSGVIAKVSRQILGIAPSDWTKYVAKTYLYKLAPIQGKAPQELLEKQHDLCGEILLEEIKELNPTHVLFLTGWGSVWDFDFPLQSILKGEAVEAFGNAENGAIMLVSRYAVRQPEDKFANDIIEGFHTLEEER